LVFPCSAAGKTKTKGQKAFGFPAAAPEQQQENGIQSSRKTGKPRQQENGIQSSRI
jgi:hypothetical protein